jgi:hypothetical protein
LLKPIQQARVEVARANRQNDDRFQAATQMLFRTLYHEAFHAYLANFVYPPREAEVPRWLNEGLAQVFETSFVEAGELRVGAVERPRLLQVQNASARGELVGLGELLRSGPRQFLVQHATEKQGSDRHYLTSWALAHYLTFERRLLGTPAMDRYVLTLKRGAEPLQAFADLTGEPPPRLEKEFHRYLLRLRPDGTAARPD